MNEEVLHIEAELSASSLQAYQAALDRLQHAPLEIAVARDSGLPFFKQKQKHKNINEKMENKKSPLCPSGIGNSSAVNRLLGLPTDVSPVSAAVGVTQTTTSAIPYRHPSNPNYIVTDFPGAGTELFPRETYCEDQNLKAFHFVILVTRGRFTETDHMIAMECRARQIPMCFVRTYFDHDVDCNLDRNIPEDETRRSIERVP